MSKPVHPMKHVLSFTLVVACAAHSGHQPGTVTASDSFARVGTEDGSCLTNGLTTIDPSLRADDVDRIRRLIRESDVRVFLYIRPALAETSDAVPGDVEVRTGCGYGYHYILRLREGRWRVVRRSYVIS
jgi:hypothetical protein